LIDDIKMNMKDYILYQKKDLLHKKKQMKVILEK